MTLFPLLDDFDRIFTGLTANGARAWVPAADLIETDDEIIARLDVPGLGADDLEIVVEDDVLRISGQREATEDGRALRLERGFGAFQRMLRLPKGVDPDAVTADVHDGVLEVHVPKPATLKPHRVEIGSGQRELEAAAA